MQIIARNGETGHILVGEEVDTTAEPIDKLTPARVLDYREDILYPPQYLGSLLNHMPYTEPYDPAPGELDELLAEVEPRGPHIGEIGVVDQEASGGQR